MWTWGKKGKSFNRGMRNENLIFGFGEIPPQRGFLHHGDRGISDGIVKLGTGIHKKRKGVFRRTVLQGDLPNGSFGWWQKQFEKAQNYVVEQGGNDRRNTKGGRQVYAVGQGEKRGGVGNPGHGRNDSAKEQGEKNEKKSGTNGPLLKTGGKKDKKKGKSKTKGKYVE